MNIWITLKNCLKTIGSSFLIFYTPFLWEFLGINLLFQKILLIGMLISSVSLFSGCRRHSHDHKAEFVVDYISEALDLNESQQAQLDQIKDELMAKAKGMHADKESMREELVVQLRSEEIDQVRDRTDLVELASEVTKVRRTGRSVMAVCPFHQEKTPSLSIDAARGLYHCFGCGKSGDVFRWVQETHALDFREANTVDIDSWDEFVAFFTPKNKHKPEIHGGFVRAHWNGSAEVEKKIGRKVNDDELASYLMYPDVFVAFAADQGKAGDGVGLAQNLIMKTTAIGIEDAHVVGPPAPSARRRPGLVGIAPMGVMVRRVLGHPVGLKDRHADPHEELDDLRGDRRGRRRFGSGFRRAQPPQRRNRGPQIGRASCRERV